MNFPPRPNQLWKVLVFLYFFYPSRDITPTGGLHPYGLPVTHRQNVYTVPQVYPLAGVGTPPLHNPAPVALVAEVLEGALGRGHSYILLYNHTLGLVPSRFLTQPIKMV
jgi:hypothetical protein